MTKECAQFIVNALDAAGEEGRIIENYSGRGMGAATTYAVVIPHFCLLIPALVDYTHEMAHYGHPVPEFDLLRTDHCANEELIY